MYEPTRSTYHEMSNTLSDRNMISSHADFISKTAYYTQLHSTTRAVVHNITTPQYPMDILQLSFFAGHET